MAVVVAHPGDFNNLRIGVLGQLSAIDMTTAAVFIGVQNTSGNRTLVLTHVTMGDFTSFPTGTALPANWKPTWGTDSATTPTNMYNAALGASAVAPCVISNPTLTATPYILPGQTLYFAVVTTTGGLGTIGVIRFCGGYTSKP